MKTILFNFAFLFLLVGMNAQIFEKVKNAAQRTAERKIEQKTEQKTEEVIDDVLNGSDKGKSEETETTEKKSKKKKEKKSKSESSSTENENSTAKNTKTVKNSSDFVPGNHVIFTDDFSQDALGDFPANWNTNGSGEVTTIDGLDGNWLNIAHASVVTPEMGKTLPENSTIEFDLFLQNSGSGRTPRIEFGLTPVKNILKDDVYYLDKFYMMIDHYDQKNEVAVEYGLRDLIGNKNNFPLTNYENQILHVAMAINASRIRVYLDGEKLIDLPRALTTEMRNNFFITNVFTVPASEQGVLISNVRVAAATEDARKSVSKQLLEDGNFSTNDILFDVNKDVIKSSSFTILNEIGETLKKNSSLKLKIVGHTDSDGDKQTNQTLSENRAIAVKNYLSEKFEINSSRLTTLGMGEEKPVSGNTTADEKAKNRRVEFIKL